MSFCELGVHLSSSPICRALHKKQSHVLGTGTAESQTEITTNIFAYEVVQLCFALSKVENIYKVHPGSTWHEKLSAAELPYLPLLLVYFYRVVDGVTDTEVLLHPAEVTSWEVGWKIKKPLGDVGGRWCHQRCQVLWEVYLA